MLLILQEESNINIEKVRILILRIKYIFKILSRSFMALRKIHLYTKTGSEHVLRLRTDKCYDEFLNKMKKNTDFEIRCENVKVQVKPVEIEKFDVEVIPEAKKSCLTRIEEILDAVTRIDYRNKGN